jgi:tRNA-2-methylthio-N6-dimethylallyladenosine synthase
MQEKKLYIETYGCQMNVDDSHRMSRLLTPLHYQLTENPEDADLILINTCSVREKASHKAHSAIGRFYPYKAVKPQVLLGLTGCQAQVEGKKLLERFHYLDFVLGPDQIGALPEVVKNLEQGEQTSIDQTRRVRPEDFQFVSLVGNVPETTSSAFVTIMKGCDNFCSFCIVPFVRGREISRPSDEILNEIRELCRQRVKEVTLLGQNVNSYGTKRGGEFSFAELLYRIAEETPIERIRFTTSHPKDVKDDLVRAFKEIPVLAQHIHLPVQSGSNAVLKKMYRTYTREEYLEIVSNLREASPEIAITTDLIVGFPGETDDDFEQTLSLMEEVRFDSAFSFLYSPRPHTTAGRYFQDDVPSQVKENRLRCLQEKQNRMTHAQNEKCVGKSFLVLVEGASKFGGTLQGRTTHNRIAHLNFFDDSLIGEMLKVKIVRATPMALMGEATYD